MRIRKFSGNFFSTQTINQTATLEEQATQPYSYQPSQLEPVSSGKTPQPRKSRVRLWLLGIFLTLLFLILVAAVVTYVVNSNLDSKYKGKIEPGVSVSGVYLGKMSRNDAKATLQKQLEGYTQKPVVLSFQDKSWHPTLDELGVSINLEGSLDKAMIFDQPTGLVESSRIYKLMNPRSTNIPLEIQLDEAKLKTYLNTISKTIQQDAVEPDLQFKDGVATVTVGQVGYQADYDKTFQAIRDSLVTLVPTQQNLLQVDTIKPLTNEADLNSTRTALNAITNQPVTIQYKDKTWTFDQKTLGSLVTLQRNAQPGQATTFSFTVKQDYVKTFVEGLAKGINQDPIDGKIGWEGHIVAKVQSKEGLQLALDQSVETVMQRINDPVNRTAQLVVNVRKPTLDTSNLEAFGVKEIIGEGVSHFGGSIEARGHNIEVGASYLTDTFIKPHSVFSFLDTVGEISQRRGYSKGYAIVAEQTVPDVGGGICQVSTTAFRAAFFAGLPIVERHEHAYRVHWYEEMDEPVGFDAAVYQPGSDMKFENPYDTWLYLQAYTSGGYLHVRLWGTKIPGQTVELKASGPKNFVPAKPDRTEIDPALAPGVKKQVDYAQRGLDADITRIIKVNGQVVKTSIFPSHFEAWSNIFMVGPTPTPKPAPPTTAAPRGPVVTSAPPAPPTTAPPATTTSAAKPPAATTPPPVVTTTPKS